MLIKYALLFIAAIPAAASNLTVCGVQDGSAGDSDGAVNGRVNLSCTFAEGVFTGLAEELYFPDDRTYSISVRGVFQGTGSVSLRSDYIMSGVGDVYPYIHIGYLKGTPGALSTGTEWMTFGGARVQAAVVGAPLPTFTTSGLGAVEDLRPFNGPETFSGGINYSAGGLLRYFDYSGGGIAVRISTDPLRIIPEPSALALCGGGLATLAAAIARKRARAGAGA